MWRRREEDRMLEEARRYELEWEFFERCRRYPPPMLPPGAPGPSITQNRPPPMLPTGVSIPSITQNMPPPMLSQGVLGPFGNTTMPVVPNVPQLIQSGIQQLQYTLDTLKSSHTTGMSSPTSVQNTNPQESDKETLQQIVADTNITLKKLSEQLSTKEQKEEKLSGNYCPTPPQEQKMDKKIFKLKCRLCERRGHTIGNCMTYGKGKETRDKLQQSGFCDKCLMRYQDHPEVCRVLSSPCKTCGDFTHFTMTCDGTKHPGSWIIKEKQSVRRKHESNALDVAITDFLNAPSLENWDFDLQKYYKYMERLANRIMEKDTSKEYFLVQTFLHKIPVELREYLVENLPKNKKDYTFDNIFKWVEKYKTKTIKLDEIDTQSKI